MAPNDEQIVKGIKSKSRKIVKFLNTSYYPRIEIMVTSNSGSIEDAEDVYQEALYIICEKIKKPNFKLSCSFFTFFYAICKYQWFLKLREKKFAKVEFDDLEFDVEEEMDNVEVEINLLDQYNLYLKHYNKLDNVCKKVLAMFIEKYKYDDIAKEIGTESIGYAWKVKHQCYKKLLESITKDPVFNELKRIYYELTTDI